MKGKKPRRGVVDIEVQDVNRLGRRLWDVLRSQQGTDADTWACAMASLILVLLRVQGVPEPTTQQVQAFAQMVVDWTRNERLQAARAIVASKMAEVRAKAQRTGDEAA